MYDQNKPLKSLIFFSLCIVLSSCGGGGSDSPVSNEDVNDTSLNLIVLESSTLSRETGELAKNILVKHQLNHLRSGPFVSGVSNTDEQQHASFISITEETIVKQLEWSGLLINGVSYDVSNGKKTFTIRVYRDVDGLPAVTPQTDIVVNAAAEDLGITGGTDKKYKFSFTSDEIFLLAPGDYWLSFLGMPEDIARFSWSVERDRENSLLGGGGVFRSSADDAWISSSAPDITDTQSARGRSFAIYGEPNSLSNEARNTHHITSYTDSWAFYYPSYYDGTGVYKSSFENIDWPAREMEPVPKYFIGIRRVETENNRVTIYVEEQPTDIELGLSSYNAVNWHFIGPGISSIAAIHSFSYHSVTFTGQNPAAVIEEYSFDNGYYLGVLGEWISSSNVDFIVQEHEELKINIQNIMGDFTLFAGSNAGNEYRIHTISY